MMDEDQNEDIQDDKGEGGDSPLIDLNDASVKKLIARAKRRGIITYDELNAALPQDQMSSEQIEDIMAAISEMGVNIVESDEEAIEFAFAASEWIEVSDRTAVRIVTVDGEAVQIEILDGPWAGRQGWVNPRQLGP